MADTECIGHFIPVSTALFDKYKTNAQISVRLSNEDTILSTHRDSLPLPVLPKAVCTAHVPPELASHSLIFIAKLYENGCTAYFDKSKSSAIL